MLYSGSKSLISTGSCYTTNKYEHSILLEVYAAVITSRISVSDLENGMNIFF